MRSKEALYKELVDSLYAIERAFKVRRHIRLHYSSGAPKDVSDAYFHVIQTYQQFFESVRQSQLWFMSVELHSRFLANSPKGLRKFITSLNDKSLNTQFSELKLNHSEVIGIIEGQRHKYLAHADDVDVRDFPSLYDLEYDALIAGIKAILSNIGHKIGSPRAPTESARIDEEMIRIFDALLNQLSPNKNIVEVSNHYRAYLRKFLTP